jgi:hypothetical protein
MRGATIRVYLTADGDGLLAYPPPPGMVSHDGCWLSDVLRALADHDVTISILVNGRGQPAWVNGAARQLEGGSRRPAVVVAPPRALGAGHGE